MGRTEMTEKKVDVNAIYIEFTLNLGICRPQGPQWIAAARNLYGNY